MSIRVKVKICGIKTQEAIEAAQGADYLGFIFYPPSPRYLTPARAAELGRQKAIKKVAVLVDPDDALLEEIVGTFKPEFLQLHGSETPERVAEIRKRFGLQVIKAIGVTLSLPAEGVFVQPPSDYAGIADHLLFDAKPPKGLPGGNGVAFDWSVLAGQQFGKPWFLSGGLDAQNVEAAIRQSGAQMVDVSSGVESAPGVKDPGKVREFIAKVRSL